MKNLDEIEEQTQQTKQQKLIKRTCAICGNEFESVPGPAKYCSAECREHAAKQASKRWKKNHPEKIESYRKRNNEYMRRKRAKKKVVEEIVKEDRISKIAVEYDTKYGDYQREKLLQESHIDVESIIASFKKKGEKA